MIFRPKTLGQIRQLIFRLTRYNIQISITLVETNPNIEMQKRDSNWSVSKFVVNIAILMIISAPHFGTYSIYNEKINKYMMVAMRNRKRSVYSVTMQ